MGNQLATIISDLRERGGLKATDIANIAAVSPATVSRWISGASFPRPKTQLLISDLRHVVDRLTQLYDPEETRLWLHAKQKLLHGERAIELIHAGRTDEVLTIIKTVTEGSYT